jgi:hypothetical protein
VERRSAQIVFAGHDPAVNDSVQRPSLSPVASSAQVSPAAHWSDSKHAPPIGWTGPASSVAQLVPTQDSPVSHSASERQVRGAPSLWQAAMNDEMNNKETKADARASRKIGTQGL